MKTRLLMILVLFATTSKANNYYFSTASGDDSRTAAQAQNPSTPWKTITKLNTFFSSLQAGDSILFNRGEIFYGSVIVNKSGSISLPIVISAFGTGERPIITGFQNLTEWVGIGDGKYECANAALGSQVNMVTVNDVEQEMGRYPNSNAANGGYLNFESHVNNTSITDNELTSSTIWTGAELVARTNRYIIDRTRITGHSGNTLSYTPGLSYVPLDGFGYFIQNDIRTLDQLGEWYYNPSTKKMAVYFGSNSPSTYNIEASAIANVIYIYNFDNIVLDNLDITGGNTNDIYIYSADYITVKNCNVSSAGIDGISVNSTYHLKIENSIVSSANNIGINLNSSINGIIRNNKIKNSGMVLGMGQNTANKSVGIRETGKNNIVEYNVVEASGYIGIRFGGSYALIKNNLVTGFNLTKDDGGGIYTTDSVVGRKITGNIVLNGIGASAGTNTSIASSTSGIYLDDDASNVEVTGNTIANCNKTGILLHNTHEITMQKNTIYNNASQQLLMSHNLSEVNSPPLRNIVVKNNILFSKNADQGVLNIMTVKNDISLAAGTMDSNYYCRPLDDNFIIKTSAINAAGTSVSQDCDLQGWKTFYNKDIATKKTAVQILTHKVNALIGANKFANGEFNTTITGINVSSTATSFTKSWGNNNIDGGTLQVVIASAKTGMTTATIPIGAVSTAKKYIIGFSVKTSKDTLMYVYARQAASPYKVLSNDGVKTIITMSAARKDYELAFTPKANEANATIFFETPVQNATWWLDNIRIYEANVTETNVDDSIRFEYNASQAPTNIPLAGTYTDARGAVYTNNIVLEPYASSILIKDNKGTIAQLPKVAPTVAITTPVANAGFTAPAGITINAIANDTDGLVSRVEFYNGSTLVGSDTSSPYAFTWNNLTAGTYMLTAKATDNDSMVTTSPAIAIVVSNPKIAPTINMTTPVSNASFTAPAGITINATANDTDGSVSKVEFYNGSTLLGTDNVSPYTLTWNNVAAGTYTLTAKATDNDSLVTSSRAVILTVNPNVAPAVDIVTPGFNADFTAPAGIIINATATDTDGTVSKVDFYNGNTLLGSDNTSPYTFTWSNVSAGTYVITAKATDNGLLVTSSSAVTISVTNPNIAPTVNITTPLSNARFTAPAGITIDAAANDEDGSVSKVEFYNGNTLLGSDNTSPYAFTWNDVSAGNYVITAKATDNGSLVTSSTAVTLSVYPNLAPTVNITTPLSAADFTAPADITINATAADADGLISKVEFYNGDTLLGADNTSPYSFTWSKVSAGAYSITAKATDNGSLVTSSSAVTISVFNPNVAPTVTITAPLSNTGFTAPAGITINAVADDEDGSVSKVEFYNGNTLIGTSNTSPYTLIWSNVAAGTYAITAKATDNGSLVTSSAEVTLTVYPNVAPTVSITTPVTNSTFVAAADITINATANDADGSIDKVEFYNGNTLLGTSNASPYAFTWSNVSAGTYAVTVKATDNGSLVTSSSAVTITVNPNAAPTVSITTPISNAGFKGPASITINAAAGDADGTVSKVTFYNGNTLLGSDNASPYSFVWKNAPVGNYTITAVATDNKGLETTSPGVPVSVIQNIAPTVKITSPAVSASYTSTSTIEMVATAGDTDGTVSKVEFFNGPALLVIEKLAPYTYTWKNVPAGNYTITAIATDNNGATTSTSVFVIVTENIAPVIKVAAVAANVGASFGEINMSAVAGDADGAISKIDFYTNNTLLRTERIAPFSYSWKNVPVGNYTITAIATDNNGLTTLDSIYVSVGTYSRGVATISPVVSSPVISSIETQTVLANKIHSAQANPISALSIKVGPTPANSVLSIFTYGIKAGKDLKIAILSISGKALASYVAKTTDKAVLVNISSLAAGIYVLQVVSGNEVVYKQFVKQ